MPVQQVIGRLLHRRRHYHREARANTLPVPPGKVPAEWESIPLLPVKYP